MIRKKGKDKKWRTKLRRGQSMVEYALIVSFIVIGGTVFGVIFLPSMIRAYDIYYKSFYAVLNLPVP
jgi:hypothetical protein